MKTLLTTLLITLTLSACKQQRCGECTTRCINNNGLVSETKTRMCGDEYLEIKNNPTKGGYGGITGSQPVCNTYCE